MISRADYLAQDAQSDQKLEFFEGQIFAMAGGTFKHAQVAGNLYGELRQALKGKPCQPMNSDMRVHTPPLVWLLILIFQSIVARLR